MASNGRSGPPPTPKGYQLLDCASALQKSIRRGLEEEALYWATELDAGGYGQYCWRRLLVVCSEDIGPAEPDLPAQIRALYENWKDAVEYTKKNGKTSHRLFLVHAVILLTNARKCRIVDHANIWNYRNPERREVPDWVYDQHTYKGRKMGRGLDHFFEESTKLVNERVDIEDPYRERAIEAKRAEKNGTPIRHSGNGQGSIDFADM